MEVLADGLVFMVGALAGAVGAAMYFHTHTQKALAAVAVAVADVAKIKQDAIAVKMKL